MKTSRLLLGLLLTAFAPLAARADTTIGIPITSVPVTINKPGKYRLTKVFNVTNSGPAITITARDVILDLNGFTLSGPSDVAEDNVAILVRGANAIIRNGTIRKFDTAISDDDTIFSGTTVEDVQCISQASTGIRLAADSSVVRRCIVRLTGQQEDEPNSIFGLHITGDAVIEHCIIEPIKQRGVGGLVAGIRVTGASFVVRECDIHDVGGIGLSFNGDESTIFDRVRIRECNTGFAVGGAGFPILRHSVIRDCPTISTGTFVDGGGNHP